MVFWKSCHLLFQHWQLILFPSLVSSGTLGMSNRDSYFYAAIVAVVTVHVVLALFVYVAWNEGTRQWREGKQDWKENRRLIPTDCTYNFCGLNEKHSSKCIILVYKDEANVSILFSYSKTCACPGCVAICCQMLMEVVRGCSQLLLAWAKEVFTWNQNEVIA